jgi:rhodanese-related sulfurtransferase
MLLRYVYAGDFYFQLWSYTHGRCSTPVELSMGGTKSHVSIGIKSLQQGAAILLISALLALSINALRPGSLSLVADWSQEGQLTLEAGETLTISLQEAEAFYYAEAALFLDARSSEEYDEGHVSGALNLPWSQFDARVGEVMRDIAPDAVIITYCDGESCSLSKELARALTDLGYTNVKVLVNGWTLWQENFLPAASGSQIGGG